MSFKDSVTDLALKGMNRGHKAILKISGGRLLKRPFGMPSVELRTVGRKSGQTRSTMLTTPIHDDSKVVLIASKGGDDRDPDWYANLVANPEVVVILNEERREMTARTASSAEKDAMWEEVVAAYKGYASYQKRTDRDIPVVICEQR